MFNNLSIRFRLNAVLLLLAVLLSAIGLTGVVGMRKSEADIRQIYENQLASTSLLAKAHLNSAVVRTTLDRAVLHPEAADVPAIVERALSYRARSEDAWKRYRALPMSGDEERLMREVEARRATFFRDGVDPLVAALRAGDGAAADKAVMSVIPPLFVALTAAVEALDKNQGEQARATYEGALARSRQFLWLVAVAIGAGILTALACAFGLHRAISVPLARMLGHFGEIARGNLTEAVVATSRDEIGALARGLQDMQRGLVKAIQTMRDGSETIAGATQEIAAGNLDLSQRTEEQAGALEETASSMEQLTAIVKQNADNARQGNALAAQASDVAGRGGEAVRLVVRTMGEIDAASKKIADITGVIEGIAFQTNILALNAAVEAARAGEEGRGFAVVAGEVRTLSQRTTTAAKEIAQLIGDTVGRVENGARQADQAGATMDEVLAAVRGVTTLMGEISSASDEQSSGIEQIGQAVTQMDQVTQQNAALVEQATAAAQALEEQARVLRQSVASFRLPAVSGEPSLRA
ncbi:methyl-accepting chemotaxis protein [Cupriavidus sp. 30B13]|uniref:methyl-accepting chemotaxis protein n=1 Tax=Cupriavidus sp. 30B13 TaxID=3384241 RepID=UPI003B900F72